MSKIDINKALSGWRSLVGAKTKYYALYTDAPENTVLFKDVATGMTMFSADLPLNLNLTEFASLHGAYDAVVVIVPDTCSETYTAYSLTERGWVKEWGGMSIDVVCARHPYSLCIEWPSILLPEETDDMDWNIRNIIAVRSLDSEYRRAVKYARDIRDHYHKMMC